MPKFTQADNKTIQELETQALQFWKLNNTFEKSVQSRPEDNQYVFYDGPPFISGLPHPAHLLGSTAKDVIPRYQTMKGKRVERVWGWDAHGLTVENKVQKKLEIKNRRDIVAYGLEKFTQECYKYTSEISAEWVWYIDRIGRWVDMDHAYKTIDRDYMESVIWVFKQLYDKGLIYEGTRTSMYCTTCGTPVSNFEVAMDNSYKDVEDPAITVKFKITDEGKFLNMFILAWTTTPWTIPSNRALVVDPKETYVVVTVETAEYIVAKKRVEAVFADMQFSVDPAQEILGADLLGLNYEPPYDFFAKKDGEFMVYAFEGMVNMEDGTGIVHSAPGFGEIDTEMGRHYNLTIMQTIADDGKFIQGDGGDNPFAGMFYIKANEAIRADLRDRALLFKDERITHRFPFHDRCNTNLIQRAQKSWFLRVSQLKEQLLANNKNINWVPEYLKDGRFVQGIEQAPDWCISRNRFWATPLPIWEAEDGDRIVIESIAQLEQLSGQKVVDLHRPYIDAITITQNGKVYTRREEVLDSWFEAASMPYGQFHYPFENREKFEKNFPGDYVCEYVAQVRAWFYVMHVISTALMGKNSFKNVISTGVMAGNDGRKMSKTFGNYTDPKEILENIGGDAFRLYLMASPLMMGENANFDLEELKTKLRNVLNPLWNSTKYFLMYAEEHNWTTTQREFSTNILDKWIVARLNQTVAGISENLETYHIPQAVKFLEEFVDDLSKWYVRRSRDRISAGDNQALSTLYGVLLNISQAAAPIIPFMTENIYQELRKGADLTSESVHLCDFPVAEELTEADLTSINNMQLTRDIVSLALSVRVTEGIKVRQPLSTLYTSKKTDEYYSDLICDEINVKEVKFLENVNEAAGFKKAESASCTVYFDITLTPELKTEGVARDFIRLIQDLRKENKLAIGDKIEVTYISSPKLDEAITKFKKEIIQKLMAETIVPDSKTSIKKLS